MSRPLSYGSYLEAAVNDDTLKVPKYIWAATLENPTQQGEFISEDRFNSLQHYLSRDFSRQSYKTRAEADAHFRERASKMGIVEYLVLRAIIAWLIDCLLDHFFGSE